MNGCEYLMCKYWNGQSCDNDNGCVRMEYNAEEILKEEYHTENAERYLEIQRLQREIERLKQENDHLRTILAKYNPYAFYHKCSICNGREYFGGHKDDCEYVQATKEREDNV